MGKIIGLVFSDNRNQPSQCLSEKEENSDRKKEKTTGRK